MTDREVRNAFDAFPLAEYVEQVRTKGRLHIDLNLRVAAATLHRDLIELNSRERGELSPSVRRRVDFAISMLTSEREFDRQLQEAGTIVPRYLWYTNVSALNHAVGFTDRRPVSETIAYAAVGLRGVVQDWLNHEKASVEGRQTFGFEMLNEDAIRTRIDRLHVVMESLPTSAIGDPPSEIPHTFNDLAMEMPNLVAIKYLIAYPLTPYHDEYAFLRTIHAGEIVFRSALLCVWEARAKIASRDLTSAAYYVTTASEFLNVLVPLFRALRTMTEANFGEGFRNATGNASAQQSLSYQHLETLVKSQNDSHKRDSLRDHAPEVTPVFAYDGEYFLSLAEQVQRIDWQDSGSAELWDALPGLLKHFNSWREFHLRQFASKDYIPQDAPGTGGTSGRSYLELQTFPRRGDVVHLGGHSPARQRRPGPAASVAKSTMNPMLPVASRDL